VLHPLGMVKCLPLRLWPCVGRGSKTTSPILAPLLVVLTKPITLLSLCVCMCVFVV